MTDHAPLLPCEVNGLLHLGRLVVLLLLGKGLLVAYRLVLVPVASEDMIVTELLLRREGRGLLARA